MMSFKSTFLFLLGIALVIKKYYPKIITVLNQYSGINQTWHYIGDDKSNFSVVQVERVITKGNSR